MLYICVVNKTLWASLEDTTADTDRPENHLLCSLTVLDF